MKLRLGSLWLLLLPVLMVPSKFTLSDSITCIRYFAGKKLPVLIHSFCNWFSSRNFIKKNLNFFFKKIFICRHGVCLWTN